MLELGINRNVGVHSRIVESQRNIDAIHSLHLLGRECKVKDRSVLSHAIRVCGLWDDGNLFLDEPAKDLSLVDAFAQIRKLQLYRHREPY